MTTAERERWLLDRQTGIGASDAASLVGCGWRTAGDVFREKTEPVNPHLPAEGPLRRGIELEDVVGRMYEEVMGVEIVYPNDGHGLTRHPLREWQFASLDRRRADTGATVSLKTTAGFDGAWGEPGSSEVPPAYTVQSQHEMGVTGTTILDLAALDVIAWKLRVYRLDFNPDYFEWLTEVEGRFWHEHVLPRVPPPSGWEDAHTTPDNVRQVVAGTRVELGEDAARLLDRRKELIRIRDQADEEAKTLTGQVEAMMGLSERATAGGWNLKRSFVKGGNVAYKRADAWRLTVTGRKS